jgi:hypothetical protein
MVSATDPYGRILVISRPGLCDIILTTVAMYVRIRYQITNGFVLITRGPDT